MLYKSRSRCLLGETDQEFVGLKVAGLQYNNRAVRNAYVRRAGSLTPPRVVLSFLTQ